MSLTGFQRARRERQSQIERTKQQKEAKREKEPSKKPVSKQMKQKGGRGS